MEDESMICQSCGDPYLVTNSTAEMQKVFCSQACETSYCNELVVSESGDEMIEEEKDDDTI